MTTESGGRKPSELMTQQQAEALARLIEAAEAGSGDAACRLGDLYREAAGGCRYSPKQAFRWYARSALAGDAWGQNNLGACHEHGLGCAQSYPNAVKWYRRAAAQGNATALMNLGYCYLSGHGVPRDTVEALRLFRLAVVGGEDRAAQEVERLESQAGPRGARLAPGRSRSDAPRPEHSPADTQQTRPCVLARSVPRRDGPPENLGTADVAARQECSTDGVAGCDRRNSAPPDSVDPQARSSMVKRIRGIRIVKETPSGQCLGLVGVAGVRPPCPDSGDVGSKWSSVGSAGQAGAGGPCEDRLETGVESEPSGAS